MFEHLPQIQPNRIAIKVKTSIERIIRKGHPWLFEAGILKQSLEGKSGDLAIIYDQRRNKFMAIGLYDPFSPIRIKILQANKPAKINAAWFKDKIEQAYQLRQSLLATDTNSYRLIYGENDGLPSFIADVYDKVLVIKLYSTIWMPYLKEILPSLLDVSQCETIVLRLSRNVQNQGNALHNLYDGEVLHGELENETVIFREHGLRFAANVIHGHKTGYFLDHRHNRKKVGQLAKGKTVLDIFSYAGGFTVHALAGGAKEVTSLDISKQALEMAKQNAQLNPSKGIHKTLAMDAFEGLQMLWRKGKTFDIVVVDPPSFAKRDSERERALKSYGRLTKMAAKIVAKGGILVSASCSSRISSDDFFEVVQTTLVRSQIRFQEIERTFHDVDHPIGFAEGAYLKCIYFKIL